MLPRHKSKPEPGIYSLLEAVVIEARKNEVGKGENLTQQEISEAKKFIQHMRGDDYGEGMGRT